MDCADMEIRNQIPSAWEQLGVQWGKDLSSVEEEKHPSTLLGSLVGLRIKLT